MKNKRLRNDSFKVMYFVIIGMLTAALLIPLLYQALVVGNRVYSVWDDTIWGSFLGSLWGGIIGGIGTLTAVIYTTRETRRIQKANEELRLADKQDTERRIRKEFSDDIVEYIGKYVTNINLFFICDFFIEESYEELDSIKTNLESKETEIQELYNEIEKLKSLNMVNNLRKNKALAKLQNEKENLIRKINEKENELKENKVDKIAANEYYNILQMKLANIEYTNDLLKQLNYVHKALYAQCKLDWAENETKKLMEITIEFKNNYINQ